RAIVCFTGSTKAARPRGASVPRPAGSIGDPTLGGAALTVYNSAGLTNDVVVVDLPAGGWSLVGGSSLKGYRFKGVGGGGLKSVGVKAGRGKGEGGRGKGGYTLDEPAPGGLAGPPPPRPPARLCPRPP